MKERKKTTICAKQNWKTFEQLGKSLIYTFVEFVRSYFYSLVQLISSLIIVIWLQYTKYYRILLVNSNVDDPIKRKKLTRERERERRRRERNGPIY